MFTKPISLARPLLYRMRSWERQAMLDARHFHEVATVLRDYFGTLQGLRMLDLGHGSRFNQLLLFHSLSSVRITGLDIDDFPLRPTSLWDCCRWLVYYGFLQRYTGRRLRFRGLSIIQGDAQMLPLADQCLDAVISNAVFEH